MDNSVIAVLVAVGGVTGALLYDVAAVSNPATLPYSLGLLAYLGGLTFYGAFIRLAFVLVVTGIALFVAEVRAIMRHSTRPSAHLKTFGAWAYRMAEGAAAFLGIFLDLFGGLRRLVHWVRDTFFRFIPKEVIEEAWRELKAGVKEIGKAPWGFVVGLYNSVRAAALPWLSGFFLFVALVVSPTAWEVALRLLGVERWLPSVLLVRLATWLYDAFFGLGGILVGLKDLKRLAIVIVSRLFGWVPIALITNSTNAVWDGAGQVLASPRGFYEGIRSWAGDSSINGSIAVVLVLVVAGGVAFVYLHHWEDMQRRRAEEEEEEEEEPAQPPRGRPRAVSVGGGARRVETVQ